MQTSPFAPQNFPALPMVAGVGVGVTACGLRYQGRDDLVLWACDPMRSTIAALFTTNRLPGEPVKWSRQCLPTPPSFLIAAAGNANVFTGAAGYGVLQELADELACREGVLQQSVYCAMTGVIGEPIASAPLLEGLRDLDVQPVTSALWQRAAEAITTTDTFAKGASIECMIADTPVRIVGIAKGSGMIAPDMATMLTFLFSDARLPHAVLQPILEAAVAESFHNISVDSDTSTSDSVMLIASGAAANPQGGSADDRIYAEFARGLSEVCCALAAQVVRDGEGITKLMEVRISGAQDRHQARRAAMSVANSPLVKTALSGADANWGRVVMAIGKAGVVLTPDRVNIAFGGHNVAEQGSGVSYDVAAVKAHLEGREVMISVDLGAGTGEARIYGNDLSYDYIRINADYRS